MKTSRLNKDTVIECAMDLVCESGITGLRLNKIADRLAVKSPSLYTHTGNITDLRQAVIQRAMEDFREQLVDSLMGRAELCAFIELGKTWATYAKEQHVFYTVFYEKEYSVSYEKSISIFLRSAFERIFLDCDLNEKEILQVERVLTNYFRGQADHFTEGTIDEEELISDLEIIYSGILQKFAKITQ